MMLSNMFSKKIEPLAYNRQFKLELNFLITSIFGGTLCYGSSLEIINTFGAETPPETKTEPICRPPLFCFFLEIVSLQQWFSTGVPSEQFRGSASCLWKMNFVCVYQKHDPILKSCARNIRLKFLIEFFTRINVIFYSLY